jgi:hypothetical protein
MFLAREQLPSDNHLMIFVFAGLLGIAVVIFFPVLEELFARLIE